MTPMERFLSKSIRRLVVVGGAIDMGHRTGISTVATKSVKVSSEQMKHY